MRPIPTFTFIGFFGIFLAAPAAAQREVARPALTPAPGGAAVIADVSGAYAQMEKNIEAQYAKLLKEARDQKSSLEDKIKDIDRQIAALKERAKKIEQVAEKMAQISAQIDALNKNKAALHGQVGALDKQIAKLEADKQKALAEGAKAQNSRLIRLPTPTPARKP